MLHCSVLAIVVLGVSGCGEHPPPAARWATMERQSLVYEVSGLVKAANPYPEKINRPTRELQVLSSTLSQKQSDIQTAQKANCLRAAKKTSGQPLTPNRGSGFFIMPEGPVSDEYQRCTQEITKDAEAQNIDLQISQIRNILDAQNLWDRNLQNQTEHVLALGAKRFAEQHDIELVIKREADAVVYNDANVSLDITDGVRNEIRKMRPEEFRQPAP